MSSDAGTSQQQRSDQSQPGSDQRSGGDVATMSRDRMNDVSRRLSNHASLSSEHGQTRIADDVVAKIAGMASREIPGVYAMGTGISRRMGQLRRMIPGGGGEDQTSTQGVAVEVGEREAALDLDVVTWYGQSIVEVCDEVRNNVIDRVQSMTGLRVVEVNINVDDVFVDSGESSDQQKQRVQ